MSDLVTATDASDGVEPGGSPSGADLVEWLEQMLVIRQFEHESVRLSFANKIPGGVHSSEGQEAVAVGSIRALQPDDLVSGTHRSHHHALAKGLTPRSVMAELFGKETGCTGGRGGSMHLVDMSRNFLGSNGIVGAGLGLAMGSALGFKMQGQARVAVGFFGDGGPNTGRTWEFINLAALWKLPLIAICENNLYAVETHISQAMAGESPSRRAAGFGLPAVTVDGQDIVAVNAAAREARERAIGGEGPTFIEARTYRYEGHNVGDTQNYREQTEVDDWRRTRDPIERLRQLLLDNGLLDDEGFASAQQRAKEVVEDAISYAEESPWPDPSTVEPRVAAGRPDRSPAMSALQTYSQAYRAGLSEEMAKNDKIFVMGTDILHRGGHFAQVLGLGEKFGEDRIRDVPISEAAMVAAGVGSAIGGMRPIVDLNFQDFAFGAMDELCNQAAKINYMFGVPVPLVVRATNGIAYGGAQHNNVIESWFAEMPGLYVAVPATPG